MGTFQLGFKGCKGVCLLKRWREEHCMQRSFLHFSCRKPALGFDAEDSLSKGADEAALLSLWDFASCSIKSVQWDS